MGVAQTILDDFTDGNFTTNPVWTINSGSASITSNALVFGGGTSTVSMSTPLVTDCQEWSFKLQSSTNFNKDNFRFYFVLLNNPAPSNSVSDGYCLDYDGDNGDFIIYRLDNGVLTSLSSYNGSTSSLIRTVRITMNASGNIVVVVSGTTIMSITSTTYPASSSEYIGITCNSDDSDAGDFFSVDDINYVAACFNPTSAGTITNAQSSCGSFNPTTITSSALPSGHTGTLEYKWQQSTTSSSSGFSDISSTNAATYDPATITQTTWYKRLSRVTCSADWTGAIESNVVEMTVASPISITGNPVSDTVYNQVGNASFGISSNTTIGVTYQWQVSTNGGSTWSNISNGGYYSGVSSSTLQVVNPITGMSTYLYRCVLTNTCGSVNSNTAILYVLPISSFSNSTTQACGTWGSSSSVSECLSRTIAVSGIGVLNSSTNLLKQINLSLGSASCQRNLNTYDFSLTSPSGTVYNFIANFSGTSTNMWVDIKFRDHPALEKVNQYSSPGNWFPYSIGYHAVDSDNSFASTFNGQNANGNWTFTMCEQDIVANNIAFNKIELVFGSKIQVNDITSNTNNNDCSNATCIGSDGVITVGTNSSYSGTDPNYPGNPVSGCDWNGANNNSAWFRFVPSSSSAMITLSGIHNGATQIETQPIVFMRSGGCNSGTFTVPNGGCPNDEAYNNSSYVGAQSAGSPYTGGISGNAEFNLSGLTAGQTYYLYVDGYGSASSTFYIEVPTGCQTCNTPLPIELISFEARKNNRDVNLTWQTASERNNDFFTVERSPNGIDWDVLELIDGAGSSTELLSYETYDNYPLKGISYYRLKQTDFDGKATYSAIKSISNTEDLMVLPNPGNGIFYVSGLSERKENQVVVMDVTGKTIANYKTEDSMLQMNLEDHPAGIYYVKVNEEFTMKIVKWAND
ncbi:MAG: T9SS type A sorting domain-containing protein [Flavobacteriia bacterium]